jgi:hypothetical protein
MSAPDSPLNSPPFPEMIWSDYDCWEGQVCLAAWAGFHSSGRAYGASDPEAPSDGTVGLCVSPNDPGVAPYPTEAQAKALLFQIQNGTEVVASVLRSLLPYYESLRPRWASYYGAAELSRIMPAIANTSDFSRLIDLRQVHVHPWTRDGLSYVGLQFGCTWDQEHGLGVMLHGARVVDIGSADTSFAWEPEEAGGA